MQSRFYSLVALLGLLFLFSCSPKNSELVVAEFGNYSISLPEFEKAYLKNVGDVEEAKTDSLSQLKNFLDLYVNYKMKLRDAEVRGYPGDSDIKKELYNYKKQVGITYIKEKKIIEPGLRKLYDQQLDELRVSHLMIRPTETRTKKQAYDLADSLLQRIKAGEKFEDLVKKYSDDIYSKDMGGDIRYIYAGTIVPSFEDAAYDTEVGSIYPEPVETRYGYHIVKVTERHKRKYQLRASHILCQFKEVDGKIDSAAALAKAQDLLAQLKNGADFAELAKQNSDDKGSAGKGGDLGFFERRMMVPPFEDAVYSLKEGEFSDIVETRYGYHIIKLTEIKPFPSFEDMKADLRTKYEQTRYQDDLKKYADNIKKKHQFSLNESNIKTVAERLDSVGVLAYFNTDAHNEVKDLPLFYLDNEPVITDSVMSALKFEDKFKRRIINKESMDEAVEFASVELALQKAALELDKTDSEFSDLMNDYMNGIFIFKIQEDEVWNKINIDSTDLVNFYNTVKDDYKWPDRVEFQEIFSKSDSIINYCYSQIKNGGDFDSLLVFYTERPQMKGKKGKYEMMDAASGELAPKAYSLKNSGDYSEPFKISDGYAIVKLLKKEKSRLKTFDEVKAEIASRYQDKQGKMLEENYLNKLREIYDPVLNYEVLKQAFKKSNM